MSKNIIKQGIYLAGILSGLCGVAILLWGKRLGAGLILPPAVSKAVDGHGRQMNEW